MAPAVADALRREGFREVLVATYVWGKGKRGTPGGSGPATLHKILAAEGLDAALARAVATWGEHSAKAAYAGLQSLVPEFGPSFYTKFLYFVGKTVPSASGPQPLILDRVLARRVRSLALTVGRETGHDPDGSITSWVWRDRNWSPHRYAVHLSFIHVTARQLAAAWQLVARRIARPARVRHVHRDTAGIRLTAQPGKRACALSGAASA